MHNNYNADRPENAGFFVRLFAYVIDMVIVTLGLVVIRLILMGVMSLLKETPLSGNILFHYNLKDIVLYVCQVLYFILLTYYTGTTLGKKLLNLQVVSIQAERKPSLFEITYRETIGRFLSAIIFFVGYIMIGVDNEKRGFHDKLSDTKVVYGKRIKIYPIYQAPPQYLPPQNETNDIKKEE
ncbi:MAG TPA: RDD family protein [Candidatus Dorea intestinavium]|nr:RDD family protein [Candidatus Dorea intestinavium]